MQEVRLLVDDNDVEWFKAAAEEARKERERRSCRGCKTQMPGVYITGFSPCRYPNPTDSCYMTENKEWSRVSVNFRRSNEVLFYYCSLCIGKIV